MTTRYTYSPGDSAVPGLGIPGLLIPGVDYLPQVSQAISIRIYDDAMSRIGEAALYTSLNLTEYWYIPHTWELRINQYLPNATTLEPKGYIGVVQDTVTGTTPFIGMIERWEPVMDRDGRSTEIWTLSGRSPKGGKLCKRRCINKFSTGDGFDTQTGVAYETAMRHIVNENAVAAKGPAGTSDTGRNLTGVTLATNDLLRGGTATELKTRGDKILDLLEAWGKASGLGTDLVWTGTGNNFVFTVLEGTDRSGAGAAKKVILSVDFRNVLAYKYLYSLLDEANVLYCGGSGDGASRLLQEVYSGSRPTGDTRNEEFLDLTDCTSTDQLTTKGTEELEKYKPVQSLSFDYDPTTSSYVLDRDFFLGDIIVVDFPGVATMTSRIISISRTWDDSGYSVQITVGTEKPDMSSLVKKIRAETSAVRRR